MRIFILEDSPGRMMSFSNMFINCELVICNSADLAVNILKVKQFDHIFLDHDLGGMVYIDSNNMNTGYQVALQLRNTVNKYTPVLIHSWNDPGTQKMKSAILEGSGNLDGCYPYESNEFNDYMYKLVAKLEPAPPGMQVIMPNQNQDGKDHTQPRTEGT